MKKGAIGIFDSGYGGLTILRALQKKLPEYNYIYFGDNARTPYGNRSFETVYDYTWQCTQFLMQKNCPLIILACNTASAKALRNIQQKHIPAQQQLNRVLGVIRPTAELIGKYTKTGHIGILATQGTVQSNSYQIEINNFWPNVTVHQQACPMLVPLIENNEFNTLGGNYFIELYVKQLLAKQPNIDVILLGCTHYPLISNLIKRICPKHIKVLMQGSIIANSLEKYLQKHPNFNNKIAKKGSTSFYTTDSATDFNQKAAIFYGKSTKSQQITL
jgi:glutamate racemase